MRWLKLHSSALNDLVLQGLDGDDFKMYINLLCHAALEEKSGDLGTLDEIAFALRVTREHVSSRFTAFQDLGLVKQNVTGGETFHIPKWKAKQYETDSSTKRVQKHRAKKKQEGTVTETAPDTDTDTEHIRADGGEYGEDLDVRKEFIPPSIEEIQKYLEEEGITNVSAKEFFNYYEARGWYSGKTKIVNWKSLIPTWVANDFGGSSESDYIGGK